MKNGLAILEIYANICKNLKVLVIIKWFQLGDVITASKCNTLLV